MRRLAVLAAVLAAVGVTTAGAWAYGPDAQVGDPSVPDVDGFEPEHGGGRGLVATRGPSVEHAGGAASATATVSRSSRT